MYAEETIQFYTLLILICNLNFKALTNHIFFCANG